MSEKFSPQAVKVMRELVKSNRPTDLECLDKAKMKKLLEMDVKSEVLIRLSREKFTLTLKAFQPILDLIAGVFVEEKWVQKPALQLVGSSGPEKPSDSDKKDGKPEDLPQGQEAE